MGEDIGSSHLEEADELEFMARVQTETDWLAKKLNKESYAYKPQHGYELEGYIIDNDGRPACENHKLLAEVNAPSFTHEIAKFNWEINGDIFLRSPGLLGEMLEDFDRKTLKAKLAAERLNLKTVFIGILPTLREDVLTLENMSSVNRYYALTERLIKLRRGKELKLEIGRNESIALKRSDLMTEAAATSLQIHTQVTLEESISFYNISQVMAGPLVAASANSPFF